MNLGRLVHAKSDLENAYKLGQTSDLVQEKDLALIQEDMDQIGRLTQFVSVFEIRLSVYQSAKIQIGLCSHPINHMYLPLRVFNVNFNALTCKVTQVVPEVEVPGRCTDS